MNINVNKNINLIRNNISEIYNNKDNKYNRIIHAAIPYFNFYGPFNKLYSPISKLLLCGENLKKGYVETLIAKETYKNEKFSLNVISLVGRSVIYTAVAITTLANFSLSMIVSTGLELAELTGKISKLIYEKNCKLNDFGKFAFKFSLASLRLAALISTSTEVLVASVAFQIISEMKRSFNEFKNGRYIEGISNLGLAIIRSYQVTPEVKKLYNKWFQKPKVELDLINYNETKSSTNLMIQDKAIERRAAIDTGSGGTKVIIVDVNVRTNEIIKVVFENSFSVPYQASLEKSKDGAFDASVKELGQAVFKQIGTIFDEYQVQKVSAVATEAFRKASNGVEFAKQIEELTHIPLRVISQEKEGIIAFNSALAVSKGQSTDTIVWDIGTGSFQITSQNNTGDFQVFTDGLGSVPLRNHIIREIQGQDPTQVTTPNPISEENYKNAGRAIRKLAKKATRELKAKIKSDEISIVGIGRLFNNSVKPLVTDGDTITRKGLRNFIRSSLNKNDHDLNNPFAYADVPNAIEVLEVMKALHMHEIKVINTTTTRGMVIGPVQDFINWIIPAPQN